MAKPQIVTRSRSTRAICSLLLILAISCLLPPRDLNAQQSDRHKRRGLTLEFGLGPSSLNYGCTALVNGDSQGTPCRSEGRFFSWISHLSVGWTINPNLILGLSTEGWNRPNLAPEESGTLRSLAVHYYPSTTSGFFVTVGVGVSSSRVGTRPLEKSEGSGPGAMAGIGFEVPMGSSYSLVLQLRGLLAKQTSLGPTLRGPNGRFFLGPDRADTTQAVFGFSIGLRFH